MFYRKSYDLYCSDWRAKRVRYLWTFNDINSATFAHDINRFVRLKRLFIQARTLENIQDLSAISQLKTLKDLFILNYSFSAFPEWIFKLERLKYLGIRGNDIQSIPNQISVLQQLTHLRIENTDLTKLPDGIRNMDKLRYISLRDNFKLDPIDPLTLPPNLKTIALTPSNISQANRNQIKLAHSQLKVL